MAFGVFTNCLSSFPPSTGQKWKFLQKKFDIVTTHNDDMLCKACFSPSLCVFHPIWVLGGGGGLPRGPAGAQPAYVVYQPRQLKNGNFQN